MLFAFRTGYRVIDHAHPSMPAGTRFVVENREELQPWIPHRQDSLLEAIDAALKRVVPEHVRQLREAASGAWR
jgi:hypothetical protein